ncbi:glycosyltransferase group 2 family protein [Parabacteroides sp. CAG:409]|nr:glycosyltransferase group 2 family protein [Parabacteroides sp. CAG:409]
MNNTILVTIGIPCYNVGQYIALSIKSVLAQTYTNFELIITDDGSTDNTVEEIKKFKDPRIKLIVDGRNRGISYRLNQQIDMAKGEFFVRMDGDDLMFPDRVEKQINYLLQHPETDVVGSSAVIIDNDNTISGFREGKNNFFSMRDILFRARYIHPTVTGRIDWFKRYRYKEEYNGCEDRNLWIRSFKNSKMYCIEEPLMFYRDAMNFKLYTYLYRMKQGRIMRIGERRVIGSLSLVIEYVIRNYIKTIVVYFIYKLGLGKNVVTRRNTSLDSSLCAKYSTIINTVINGK